MSSRGMGDGGSRIPRTLGLQDSLGPSTEAQNKKEKKGIVSSGIRTRKIKVKCNSNLFAQLLNAAIAVAAVDVAAVVRVAVARCCCCWHSSHCLLCSRLLYIFMTAQIGPHRHPRATLSAYGNKWATGVAPPRSPQKYAQTIVHYLYIFMYISFPLYPTDLFRV